MKTKPLIVGLTGGIGSGKSLALSEFRRRGAQVLDLDAVARSQARRGGPAYAKVVRAFGREVLGADGQLDRRKLGALVFRKPALRKKLERLTHPPILAEMTRRMKTARGVLVVDIPLLFEGGHQKHFDAVVAVSAPLEKRLARVMRRDGVTRAQAAARAKAQFSDAQREALADVVVRNDGAPAQFKKSVAAYCDGLRLLQKGEQTVPR